MRETERFDNADWLKRFEIRFVGELGKTTSSHSLLSVTFMFLTTGTDLGGLNREFVELLSRELFSENNGFFARLDTESQQVM